MKLTQVVKFIFLLFWCAKLKAQTDSYQLLASATEAVRSEQLVYNKLPSLGDRIQRRGFTNDVLVSLGLAVGNEHFLGPKLSVLFPFRFKRGTPKLKRRFYRIGWYVSIDGSIFIAWGGIGLNAGLSLENFTIDNSLTYFGASVGDGNGTRRISYNPKIGYQIGRVWLKAGPSFSLESTVPIQDWLKVGSLNYNIELNFFLD